MRKQVIASLIDNGISPYALINSLMVAAANENNKLTPEEKVERKERRRLLEEERVRVSKITQNVCPSCDGKLKRGKKDKKNEYKRLWECIDCGTFHNV